LNGNKATLLLLILLILTPPAISRADWFDDTFIDPTDHMLDTSNWLLEKKGFLPVPIIITEPAIGYGGGLALIYFHDKLGAKKGSPPSVSGIAAGGTENGTWFAGGGHMGIWKNDTIRYQGGLGVGRAKMDYYGRANQINTGIEFESKVIFLNQELQFRLGKSNFFAGIGYTLAETENTFKLSSDKLPPDLPGVKFDNTSAAGSVMISYDSRNNMFTPGDGLAAEIKAMLFEECLGSDQTFQKYSFSAMYYKALTDSLILGLRGDGESISGNAPFYSYPYIDMRGIKAMQYQGEQVLLSELELRWDITARYSMVGFVGAGKAYNDAPQSNSKNIYAKGLGFRYLIASKLGLQMGVDVAKGPNDTAIYIQFGSSWSLK